MAYVDESHKRYIGKEFTPEEFAKWFAVQKLGSLPANAVGIHHTYMPNENQWQGVTSLNNTFGYYSNTLGWPWGTGPHFWLYAGDGGYKRGQKLIYVGTHPAHDGIGISYRNHRYFHIEAVGYYDSREMPQAMRDLYRFCLKVICGQRIPIRDAGAGVDGPASPLGQIFHRNAPAAGKTCPGNRVQESWFFPEMRKESKPPVKLPNYNRLTVMYVPTEWTKGRVEFLKSLKGQVSFDSDKARCQAYSQIVYDSSPVGAKMLLALGKKSASLLSGDAKDVLGEYGAGVSDVRRGFSDAEVVSELETMVSRGVLPKGSAKKYAERFKVPKDEGPLTLNQLTSLYQTMSRDYYASRLDGLNKAMRDGKINTPRRLAYFLANVGHESGGLKYVEEIASGAAYEWRRDLGNVYAGDGVRFKGRGYLQITGRFNYTQAGKDLGFDFVSNPEAMEEPYWAARVSTWFWNKRNLSAYADAGNWAEVCRLINGRYPANGQADRDAYLRKAQAILA